MPELFQKEIAYVLKGYPRLSETFISSEIYRLEKAGVKLRIFVIKESGENTHHPTVKKIKSKPVYLPKAGSISKISVREWLNENYPGFRDAVFFALKAKPFGFARAALKAVELSFRSRQGILTTPKKKLLKEFLQAAALSEQVLKSQNVGHLHAHFCHGATTVTWLASIITELPFSFTAHAKDIYSEQLSPNDLLKRKMDNARFVATCTDANKKHLDGLGSKTEVHSIYHGINADFSELLEKNDASSTANGKLNALAVGRLVEKKGFDTLIDACNIMQQKGVNFAAKIIGESGEMESEIKKRIARYGLSDSVTIAKPMTQTELFHEYKKASVFCLPSRIVENGDRDGIPNVLAEAMACGLPVVSTNISGIPEIVKNEVSGLLVAPDKAEELADALMRINKENGLKERLGSEAKLAIKEKFDADEHIKKLIELFRRCLC